MAKVSAVNKNNKRIKLSDRLFKKRQALKKIVMDKKISLEERFKAQQKLSNLPRNSAKNRVMNRCQITGRPHGVYRKLRISAILTLKLEEGNATFLWFLTCAFFILAIISPIGSLKLILSFLPTRLSHARN